MNQTRGVLTARSRGPARKHLLGMDFKYTAHKFIRRVEKIFDNLPKSLRWRSLYEDDLKILMGISQDVK